MLLTKHFCNYSIIQVGVHIITTIKSDNNNNNEDKDNESQLKDMEKKL